MFRNKIPMILTVGLGLFAKSQIDDRRRRIQVLQYQERERMVCEHVLSKSRENYITTTYHGDNPSASAKDHEIAAGAEWDQCEKSYGSSVGKARL